MPKYWLHANICFHGIHDFRYLSWGFCSSPTALQARRQWLCWLLLPRVSLSNGQHVGPWFKQGVLEHPSSKGRQQYVAVSQNSHLISLTCEQLLEVGINFYWLTILILHQFLLGNCFPPYKSGLLQQMHSGSPFHMVLFLVQARDYLCIA